MAGSSDTRAPKHNGVSVWCCTHALAKIIYHDVDRMCTCRPIVVITRAATWVRSCVRFANAFLQGTDMLLKPKRSACPGVVVFNDNMKGTEQLMRQRHREREGDYNQWDRSRLPKMLSIPLVYRKEGKTNMLWYIIFWYSFIARMLWTYSSMHFAMRDYKYQIIYHTTTKSEHLQNSVLCKKANQKRMQA